MPKVAPAPAKKKTTVKKTATSGSRRGAVPVKTASKSSGKVASKPAGKPVAKTASKPAPKKAVAPLRRAVSKAPAAPAKALARAASKPRAASVAQDRRQEPVKRPASVLPLVVQTSATSLLDAASDPNLDPGPLSSSDVGDETDMAQHLQLREQAEIQRRARLMNQPETHPDFDGEHCVECDVEIPVARLLMHKVRCVDCQSVLEESARRANIILRATAE